MGVKKRIRKEIKRQQREIGHLYYLNRRASTSDPNYRTIVQRNCVEIIKCREIIGILNGILSG